MPEPLRGLDRAACRRGRHGRLRRWKLLPAESEHPRPDGGVSDKDFWTPGRGLDQATTHFPRSESASWCAACCRRRIEGPAEERWSYAHLRGSLAAVAI